MGFLTQPGHSYSVTLRRIGDFASRCLDVVKVSKTIEKVKTKVKMTQ